MPWTTVDIEAPILEEIRKLQQTEGNSLGRIISRLLAEALAKDSRGKRSDAKPLKWIAKPMGPQVDLSDKDARISQDSESRRRLRQLVLTTDTRSVSLRRHENHLDAGAALKGA